ncbi:unnamed protein product [Meloidogyne enterolobii]|uniref:Uncharacterized protein n=1 Tax=Meloidogyne enterolobii TaxID=390850 RepID=A0ACB1AF75_MELEN
MFKHKYDYRGIRNRFHDFNCEYNSGKIKNIKTKDDKKLKKELHQLNDKYEKGEIKNIVTEENEKIKGELKLFNKYKKIEKEIKVLETELESLEESIKLKEKINERDEMTKKIEEIKEKNDKELDEKLNMIGNEQKKIWEEKLEKIKNENEEILKENKEIKRKEMLEKYDDFIVELKEMWFGVVFYHVYDKVYKNENKKKISIKITKESEKGKASTGSNIKTFQDEKDEYILYFNEITLIKKTFLPEIYGKEYALELVKGKKHSAIFVQINGKITKEGKFFENQY